MSQRLMLQLYTSLKMCWLKRQILQNLVTINQSAKIILCSTNCGQRACACIRAGDSDRCSAVKDQAAQRRGANAAIGTCLCNALLELVYSNCSAIWRNATQPLNTSFCCGFYASTLGRDPYAATELKYVTQVTTVLAMHFEQALKRAHPLEPIIHMVDENGTRAANMGRHASLVSTCTSCAMLSVHQRQYTFICVPGSRLILHNDGCH